MLKTVIKEEAAAMRVTFSLKSCESFRYTASRIFPVNDGVAKEATVLINKAIALIKNNSHSCFPNDMPLMKYSKLVGLVRLIPFFKLLSSIFVSLCVIRRNDVVRWYIKYKNEIYIYIYLFSTLDQNKPYMHQNRKSYTYNVVVKCKLISGKKNNV